MRHEPRGFQRDAQGPVKLVARNALLAAAYEVGGLQPLVERDMTGLKHGSDLRGELLPALSALL